MPDIRLKRGTIVELIDDAVSSSLTNGSFVLSSEYDNESNLYPYGEFELVGAFGVSPTGGSQIVVYLIQANDSTNYCDGSASITPAANLLSSWFVVRATTSSQRLISKPQVGQRISLPPTKFKALLKNDCGQTLSAGYQLNMLPYCFKTV